MAEPLERMARRLESDPFFLACPLALFAGSSGLEDADMAHRLGCSAETLILVRLCRAPQDGANFKKDIDRIATKYRLNAGALTEAVRHGQAIWNLRRRSGGTGTLLAARDKDAAVEDEP